MRRRDFLTLVGGATPLPIAARAQRSSTPVIGFLGTGSPGALQEPLAAFYRGLGEMGYIEGQNIKIEYRFAEGQYNRLPALAAQLVQHQVTAARLIGTRRQRVESGLTNLRCRGSRSCQ
jgi:putative ABC transport system substrate-binding protein